MEISTCTSIVKIQLGTPNSEMVVNKGDTAGEDLTCVVAVRGNVVGIYSALFIPYMCTSTLSAG